MNLSAIFIRRPVTTTLLIVGMLVFGVRTVVQARSLRNPSAKEAPFELLPAEGGLRT